MSPDLKSLWFETQAQESVDVLRNLKLGDKESEQQKGQADLVRAVVLAFLPLLVCINQSSGCPFSYVCTFFTLMSAIFGCQPCASRYNEHFFLMERLLILAWSCKQELQILTPSLLQVFTLYRPR